jgi:streptomycin 6-kinase
MFETWLSNWSLSADGDPIVTPSSRLLPVRRNGEAAMLKITDVEEEKRGGGLMEWWAGDGAARVLARDHGALLLERAEGSQSLTALSQTGRDEEASAIICRAAVQLHAPGSKPLPPLTPLKEWFAALEPAARIQGGYFARSGAIAKALLAAPHEVSVLHGDIHHGNILDFGPRGWLAIDPKALIGERVFDFANLFCNPDMAISDPPVASRPEVFARRLELVCREAKLERERLLSWIIAYAGLSSAWLIAEGIEPKACLSIGAMAEAALAA